ncbi:hypothetical protein MHY83_24775, partial [Klebsiella quasipneumoniae subsp. similipneumoniae]|nr:hypothetical protein [Klebsiella quasipneumoniae subsp. similipneumoniae]
MNSHKNYKELGLLQDFFRKNHKATFNCDQNKVEITSSDITPLLVKGKSNFQQAKFCLSGPVMHLRYQPLWFAILLGLNAREGANKWGNSSRLTQSFHFFMFEPIF